MKTDIFGESIAESQPSPETEETIFSEVDEAEEGQEGDTDEQGTPEKGQSAPKQKLYAGKFKNEDELEQGYINLMNYLGRDLETFTSVEDLERAYIEAEKERGKPKDRRRKEEPKTNEELEKLRQAYYQQQLQMQQLVGYLQAMQLAQQKGQSAQPQQKQEEKVDPSALLDQWYENPQETLNKMVTPLLQEQLKQLVPQYAQLLDRHVEQKLMPFRQRMEFERAVQEWSAAKEEVARQLPDFESLSNEIAAEFEKDPNLASVGQASPQGKILAIRAAYDRVKAIKAQQEGLDLLNQQQTKQSVLQKQAAKMGSSSKVLKKPEPTEEQKMLNDIFGAAGTSGIFDL